ncbi:MAG: RHS repeat-associated core domain-containing protein, partial [Thermofilaceae archaeon]
PDAQGQLRKVAEVVYTYDHQGQLIREERRGQSAYVVEYTYDKVGNRLMRTRTINGQTTVDVLSYNEANQLTSLNGQTWVHDADGNVVVRRVNGESWELGYDSEGNLVHLKRQGALVGWVYTYDGLGRRVKAQLGSNTIEFLYGAGETLLAERANGGAWVYNSYGVVMYQRGGEWQYWDYSGNRVGSSDASGQVQFAASYDAFGDLISGIADLYDWNGAYHHRADPLTGGLVQVGIRWYDPYVGRFLQRDPAYAAPVYSYCGNDPINAVDILGWKPGDKYKSPDAAAKRAIQDVWDQHYDDLHRREYGGWIYKNPDGSYSYTPPHKGGKTRVEPPLGDIPEGATRVGGYHTHPWTMYPSEPDKKFARDACILIYTSSPPLVEYGGDGIITRYDPERDEVVVIGRAKKPR